MFEDKSVCKLCGKSLEDEYEYGFRYRICEECFEDNMLPKKMSKFQFEKIDDVFDSGFFENDDALERVDKFKWMVVRRYIPHAIEELYETVRNQFGVDSNKCREFLQNTALEDTFADWICEKEYGEGI